MSDLQVLVSEAEDTGSNQRIIQYMESFAAQMENLADWSAKEAHLDSDTPARHEASTISEPEADGYQTPANQVKGDPAEDPTANGADETLPSLSSSVGPPSGEDTYQEAYGLLGQSSQLNLAEGSDGEGSWEGYMLQAH